MNSPHKGQGCGNFDVFFDLGLNQRLSKQSEAVVLIRHHAHYDVTVMSDNSLCTELDPEGLPTFQTASSFEWHSFKDQII